MAQGIILFMLPGKRNSKPKSITSRNPCSITYALTEHSLIPHINDLISNGSSSQKRTTNTDASFIKCKKINNKQVNLRTEPHQQYKRIQDVQEKYISTQNRQKQSEPDILTQTLNYTNRNTKKHKHIVTQLFNNTGKYSHKTQCKCKYLDDIAALESKTTTRKTRKHSHHNINIQTQGNSKIPTFQLRSPSKKDKKNKINNKSKSIFKQQISKTIGMTISSTKNQKKIKVSKHAFHLPLQKIQKKVILQALQLSNLSYGQHSKSQPDLYHRVVQSQEISFQNNHKQNAINTIKKYWKEYKKKVVLKHYRKIFQKVQEKSMEHNKVGKTIINVPAFNIDDFENALKQKTISEHLNEDFDLDFNVKKYVTVEPQVEEEEVENITKIKKMNKRLQKQLLKFKQKQLSLCEKFQSMLMTSEQNIRAQELLQLIMNYKAQVIEDKKSSQSSVSYKQLIEQNGIADKIKSSKNAQVKTILDDEQNLMKHKMSSKSLIQQIGVKSSNQKHPTSLTPQINKEQGDYNTIQTNILLSTYLDCQLENIVYQKQSKEKEELDPVQETINDQISKFSSEDLQPQKLNMKQVVYQIAKTEQFQNNIENFLIEELCQQVEKSPSILRTLHEMQQILNFNKTLKIEVALPNIIEYLKGLIQYIFRNKKIVSVILQNINKPLGSSALELLYYLRPNTEHSQSDFQGENPYNFIIPMGVFEEYESISRSGNANNSQQAILIHYFWHRSLYEVFNELLDRKRPYGLAGKPYCWNYNIFQNFGSITFQRLTKIFQGVLGETLEILSFPTGLMFDSPLCQYYRCDLSYQDKMKINQDRLWLIICEQIVDEQPNYRDHNDEVAEVLVFLADYVQDMMLFQAVVALRKLSRQRFLLSI